VRIDSPNSSRCTGETRAAIPRPQPSTGNDESFVRDMETILAAVRDPASREQLEDLVRAYQAGAFRATFFLPGFPWR